MLTWTPTWKRDLNPEPRDVLYEWLDETTGETIFNVEVSAIGLIRVIEDDWLSKYSKAIHHDFEVSDRFVRLWPTERGHTIENVDLIYKGEILVHKDSARAFSQWLIETDAVDKDVPQELQDELTDMSTLTRVATAVDVVGWLAEFAPLGAAAAGISGALTGLNVIIFVIGAGLDIVDVNHPERDVEKFYAILYATTAWVFDKNTDMSIPAIAENLGDFNESIPQLHFPVPSWVANPKAWYTIHYQERVGMGLLDKGFLQAKLNLLRAAWEETTSDRIEQLDDSHGANRPDLTLPQYKKTLRTVVVPSVGLVELTPAQFFQKLRNSLLTHLEKTWTGPVRLIRTLAPKHNSFYNLP